MTGPGQCGGCDGAILWADSATSGKGVAVDAEPSPDGNVYVQADPRAGGALVAQVRSAQSATNMRDLGHQLHRLHAQTCPAGADRGKRRVS